MADKTYIVENANNPIESDFYKDIIQKDANGNPLVDSQNRIRVKRYVVHGSVGLNEASVDAKINTAKSEINSTIADLHHVTTDTTQTVSGNKTFTGETRVPTVNSSDSSTKAASTAFVQGKVTALQNTLNTFLDSDDATLDQASELVAAIKANKKDIASLVADKATKVELAKVASKATKAITDVGQVVDPATHMPIKATTTSVGVVQLATAQDITNGTANKVVDAQELNNFVQTLPSVNGVTDVSSGDNSNQLVVSRIGGSKTLTIDNVEHAGTATSADSVAWDKVSGKPSTFTPSGHDHTRYGMSFYNVCDATNTGWYESCYKGEGDDHRTHLYINDYFGIHFHTAGSFDVNGNAIIHSGNIGSQSVNYANSAGAVAWNNVSGKPSSYTPSSHTHDDRYYTESEIDTKLSGKSNTNHTHSNYLTGITKAMVTNALGYTPPTQDTNTWNALKGSTTSAAGTAGYAPAPAAGAANRYLRCDGTWQVPPDHTYTVNNATLTIQKNGSNVATFTSNASSNVTANISVPTKVSQLTNDVGFITSPTSSLEMYETSPYIDFHAMKSTNDHTSRIIDQGTTNVGRLRILARYDSISYQVEMYKNFFEPVNDNEICLGDSANRWRNIFSATGSISTSDQRAKNSIENIDDSLLDAWSNVQPKQYKFNDATKEKGDSARYHTGYLAQDIQKACEDSKISIDRYGLFCHDSWEEQDEVIENIESEVDGIKTTEKRIVQQKREKGDMYALRYEEALVVECAYLRRENSRMKEKLVSLEERLEKLEKAEK